MGKTSIGWTDETWNVTTGCSHVSDGCTNCYAETLSLRRGWSMLPWTHQNAAENVVLHPNRLEYPLHWRKPRMVFVDSMSDLFHKQVPFKFIAQTFDVMADVRAALHFFQVLTKRPHRMRKFFVWLEDHWQHSSPANFTIGVFDYLPNVWLGVSVEDQRRADERIPVLLDTPAAVRWLSCEPLLGPIDLAPWVFNRRSEVRHLVYGPACLNEDQADSAVSLSVDWVVVGGESGPGHRPMKIEWLESIVEQCRTAKVPVFVKQDSGSLPEKQGRIPDELWALKQFPQVAA